MQVLYLYIYIYMYLFVVDIKTLQPSMKPRAGAKLQWPRYDRRVSPSHPWRCFRRGLWCRWSLNLGRCWDGAIDRQHRSAQYDLRWWKGIGHHQETRKPIGFAMFFSNPTKSFSLCCAGGPQLSCSDTFIPSRVFLSSVISWQFERIGGINTQSGFLPWFDRLITIMTPTLLSKHVNYGIIRIIMNTWVRIQLLTPGIALSHPQKLWWNVLALGHYVLKRAKLPLNCTNPMSSRTRYMSIKWGDAVP